MSLTAISVCRTSRRSRSRRRCFKVSGGDLRLHRCRLYGPYVYSLPANYRGLIQFNGSGDVSPERVRQCIVNESALVTDGDAVLLRGIGARLLVRHKRHRQRPAGAARRSRPGVQGTGEWSVRLRRAPVSRRAAPSCNSTMRRPSREFQSRSSSRAARPRSCNPSGRRTSPVCSATAGAALAHGLLVWQSDATCSTGAIVSPTSRRPIDPPLPSAGWSTAWKNLWGSHAVQPRESRTRSPPPVRAGQAVDARPAAPDQAESVPAGRQAAIVWRRPDEPRLREKAESPLIRGPEYSPQRHKGHKGIQRSKERAKDWNPASIAYASCRSCSCLSFVSFVPFVVNTPDEGPHAFRTSGQSSRRAGNGQCPC